MGWFSNKNRTQYIEPIPSSKGQSRKKFQLVRHKHSSSPSTALARQPHQPARPVSDTFMPVESNRSQYRRDSRSQEPYHPLPPAVIQQPPAYEHLGQLDDEIGPNDYFSGPLPPPPPSPPMAPFHPQPSYQDRQSPANIPVYHNSAEQVRTYRSPVNSRPRRVSRDSRYSNEYPPSHSSQSVYTASEGGDWSDRDPWDRSLGGRFQRLGLDGDRRREGGIRLD